uniref:CD209 antigen-like protein 2 isoform X1 n=1 Tax=Podarcis muralis TaxID=64176 RepID=UPI0010A00023|nr:CD209 antigen-like protein 2 isoform X1 [Podarcis muralis]XP_028600712.1 CD209 antigen-like protein 2 isoform X1 [Podarcis muralis]
MGKPAPAKPAKPAAPAKAAAPGGAEQPGTGVSGFQKFVNFVKSPMGEYIVVFMMILFTALTLLLFLLYQKELKKRAEFQMAIDMIRTFVVGLDSIHEDKDDFGILAVAQNKSEEMRHIANKNDELQKEIDLLIGNLNDGWIIYQRTMYLLSREQDSWADSKKKCEREGAQLLSMETREEQYFINREVQKRNKFYWFGVFKDSATKKWRWLVGIEAIITYWKPDEPKNEDRNHCAAMGLDCDKDCWIALHCEQRLGYICKKVPSDAWL